MKLLGILCVLLTESCAVSAWAESSDIGNAQTMAVVLKGDDIQHEPMANTENNPEENRTMNTREEAKIPLAPVIRQTEIIGTIEHPTIDGGLISVPEFAKPLELTEEGVARDASLIILSKLNDTFNHSAAYNLKVLMNISKQAVLTVREKVKAKGRVIVSFWKKAFLQQIHSKPSQPLKGTLKGAKSHGQR